VLRDYMLDSHHAEMERIKAPIKDLVKKEMETKDDLETFFKCARQRSQVSLQY